MHIIKIDKPQLNEKMSDQMKLALMDKWIAETTDKLNFFIQAVVREVNKDGNSENKSN